MLILHSLPLTVKGDEVSIYRTQRETVLDRWQFKIDNDYSYRKIERLALFVPHFAQAAAPSS